MGSLRQLISCGSTASAALVTPIAAASNWKLETILGTDHTVSDSIDCCFKHLLDRSLLEPSVRDSSFTGQVLDGDGVFLYHQSLKNMETAAETAGQDVSKAYYMPASLDSGVRALRRWLAKNAEPIPWGPGALKPAAQQTRSELLDRMEQHTKLCPSCSLVSRFQTLLLEPFCH